MTLGSLITTEDGKMYELKKFLGSGALGGVYLGRALDGSEIAVKIPHRDLTPASLDSFWQELEVLKRLNQVSGGRFFPNAWRGRDDTGREVLCLSLARGRRLVDLAAENPRAPGHLDESIALPAGIEYVKMIQTMHQARISCPDRKANDLFWDESRQALLVLDWNVVDTGEDFEKKKDQDLVIFGSMWYELLTGNLPPPRDQRLFRPLSAHPYWSQISFGLRHVLERLLSTDPAQRYVSPEETLKDLQTQWQDAQSNAQNLSQRAHASLIQAQRAFEKGQEAIQKALALTRYYSSQEEVNEAFQNTQSAMEAFARYLDEAERLGDLAQRKGAANATRLMADVAEMRGKLHEFIRQGVRQVVLIQYTGAISYLQAAQTIVGEPGLRLNLYRWFVLAQAGRKGPEEADLYLSDFVDDLAKILNKMEEEQWNAAWEDWTKVESRLKQSGWREDLKVGEYVFSLGREISFWLIWHEGDRAENERRFDVAAQAYGRAAETLGSIPEDYRQRILAVAGRSVEEFRDLAHEMSQRDQIEGRVDNILHSCREALEDGEFLTAIVRAEEGLALLSGVDALADQRDQLRMYRRLAQKLMKLENASEGKAWTQVAHILYEMAQETLPPPQDGGNEFAWTEIQDAVNKVLAFLRKTYGNTPSDAWQGAHTLYQARAALETLSVLNDLYQQHRPWWNQAIASRLKTSRAW